jgi:NAD(P)-dependent dehydrogenase (short-subunit alcohol dehydrogenase family)
MNDPATLRGVTGMTGRRALVTGGNPGVGAATAAALSRVGCEVTVTARGVPPQLGRVTSHSCQPTSPGPRTLNVGSTGSRP